VYACFCCTPEVNTPDTSSTYTTVQPRINWTGTAKLNTTSYQNITSSNNVFPDSPTVTSDANNPGTVTLRVIDDKGKQVGSTKTVSPGKDVVLDQIPALSGTYTIQGKASVAGTYTFNVD
jgi:hypothetical protein